MRTWYTALFVVSAAALAAGCGGGGGHSAGMTLPATVASAPAKSTSSSGVTSTVTMNVTIPATGTSAIGRRPLTIPAATQSISIAVNGGTAQAFNASGSAIHATVAAPLGSDSFTVIAYDAVNGGGTMLATGSATATINSNQANTVAIVLTAGGPSPSPSPTAGIVSVTVTISAPTPLPNGTAQPITIALVARDGSNNVVSGTYAAPFTVRSSDTVHYPVTAGATIANSTTTATVSYDGSCTTPAVITIGGPATGSATIGTNRHAIATFADSSTGSLRSYLQGATNGDIIVGPTSGTITLASTLPAFAGPYTVCGAPSVNLVVDGASAYSMFAVASSALFQNLTLQHGFTSGAGAFIAANGTGTLTISNVTFANGLSAEGGAVDVTSMSANVSGATFSNNSGAIGGGIDANSSALTVAATSFTSNSGAGAGGAIAATGTTTLTVSNCTFTSNSSTGSTGGAIGTVGSGSATIAGSTFTSNSANTAGGAIAYGGSSAGLAISTSTFQSNTSVAGGAMYLNSSNVASVVTIAQSSFNQNTATAGGNGGAIDLLSQSALIQNTSLYGNTAAANGGGVAAVGGVANIEFSTFYSNNATAGDGGNLYNNSGLAANLVIFGNIIQSGTAAFSVVRRPQVALHSVDLYGYYTTYGGNLIGDTTESGPTTIAAGSDLTNTSSNTLVPVPAGTPPYLPILATDVAVGEVPLTGCTGGIGPFPGTTVDQRGGPRPHSNANCSSGAYEP